MTKKGDQEKIIVIEGGSNIFAPPLQKKNRTGTFDAVTRTALHFSRADQGYLSCYFYLKTFKNKKKRFQNTDCKTNLDPLFTFALSDCQNAFSILCEVFNSIEEVTLSIVRELKSQFL